MGAGDPIVLVPDPEAADPIAGEPARTLIEGLTRLRRSVVTFDPPGAGRSTRRAALDLPEMIDGIGEAIAAAGVQSPVDLIGHGLAGIVALGAAIEEPAIVRRLIVSNTAAGIAAFREAGGAIWNLSHPNYWPYALISTVHAALGRRATEKALDNLLRRLAFRDRRAAGLAPIRPADWLRTATPRSGWRRRVAAAADYRERLDEIVAPTLILAGRHDVLMPPAGSQAIADRIPGSHLIVFERSGHYPFLEEPAAFWQVVAEFS